MFLKRGWPVFTSGSARAGVIGLAVVAVCVGTWLGMSFEYGIGSENRIQGAPIPVAFFRLEDGQWIDFVPPRSIQILAVIADALSVVTLAICSAWLIRKVAVSGKRKLDPPPLGNLNAEPKTPTR